MGHKIAYTLLIIAVPTFIFSILAVIAALHEQTNLRYGKEKEYHLQATRWFQIASVTGFIAAVLLIWT